MCWLSTDAARGRERDGRLEMAAEWRRSRQACRRTAIGAGA